MTGSGLVDPRGLGLYLAWNWVLQTFSRFSGKLFAFFLSKNPGVPTLSVFIWQRFAFSVRNDFLEASFANF